MPLKLSASIELHVAIAAAQIIFTPEWSIFESVKIDYHTHILKYESWFEISMHDLHPLKYSYPAGGSVSLMKHRTSSLSGSGSQ